ncbi:hypothetical protein BJ741DRAFT_632247 [Chytriomyces cf. hyalinus JEL632]|nr:hypothetical protein BJ741DRAFT_632247 [Chytriomyces cf. hyalinus JEL632]
MLRRLLTPALTHTQLAHKAPTTSTTTPFPSANQWPHTLHSRSLTDTPKRIKPATGQGYISRKVRPDPNTLPPIQPLPCPLRPPTAFMLWLAHKRYVNVDMTSGVAPRSAFDLKAVVNLDYSDEYREIGKLKRAPYVEKAKSLKDKYSVEMKKHLESLQGHAEKGSGRNKRDKDPETIAARKAALKETQERRKQQKRAIAIENARLAQLRHQENSETRTALLNPNLADEGKIDRIAKDVLFLKRATLRRADLKEEEKEPKKTATTRKTESATEYVPPFVKAALAAVKKENALKEKAALDAKNTEIALQEKEAKPALKPNQSGWKQQPPQ